MTSNAWLAYALLTAGCFGIYGVLLHTGTLAMSDPNHGRYKAFLCVGIAYLLVAILGPSAILLMGKASWTMPAKGLIWSLLAGAAGAVGAFGIILAFGAKGHPAVVMSIVFAGAPVVNALVVFSIHPPQGGLSAIRWQFVVGLIMAVAGATMVTLYKPAPGGAPPTEAPPSKVQDDG